METSFHGGTYQTREGDKSKKSETVEAPDPELILPRHTSVGIIVIVSTLLQLSFFIIIPSSNDYAQYLGGNSVLSGLTIGIPTAVSALVLFPLTQYDGGTYGLPLHLSCAACILGHIIYSLAFRARYLYLLLIGRIVNGFGFAMWMYCKRYCSDPRVVGVRRRTTLACFLVVGQGLGTSAGPFFGGLLYKVGFKSSVFNGFTSPGWIMAGIWCIFWVCVVLWFEDIPQSLQPPTTSVQEGGSLKEETSAVSIPEPDQFRLRAKMGTIVCMCWFAMTSFFVVGAWEANIPVFGASTRQFHWSPYEAGNFIALGGVAAFPFLVLNIFMARRIEDRKILFLGFIVGLAGLLTFLALLETDKLNYASVFMCWWAVALGFNVVTTVPISLLSKQLPPTWNNRISLTIQNSMYTGRVLGAIWGGSGIRVGMRTYVGVEIALVGIGMLLYFVFWHDLKTKRG
ncbi:hypothetical protein AX15_007848 [Amanita polypyramis BW_CC]|nr:hypothetical protein AX15_007848 [Amanita polypyramis BW_CC]